MKTNCTACGADLTRPDAIHIVSRLSASLEAEKRAAVLEDCLVTLIVNICQSRKMRLDKLVDVWEDSGIHHLMVHYVWPETDEQEGDEYARSIDAFENEIISRAEAILSGA